MPVHKELAEILSHYDIGECQALGEIEHGYVNKTWLVEAKTGRYVLKRRHPGLRQADFVAAQHALIEYLHGVGFPAPRIVRTSSGTTSLCLAEDVYELQRYIPGVLCDRMDAAQVAASARTLGLYHRLVSGFDHLALHRQRDRYSPGVLEGILGRLRRDGAGRSTAQAGQVVHDLASHAQQLATHLAQLDGLPHLVIHGDYYADNIIFQGDRVVGVVDYDQARWAARVQEVAEAVIYFAQEHAVHFQHIVYAGTLDLDAVCRFLAAYTDVVCLSRAEIHALPHMIRTIWLCASLDPPLHPRPELDTDLEALREALALADWARARAQDIRQVAADVQSGKTRR